MTIELEDALLWGPWDDELDELAARDSAPIVEACPRLPVDTRSPSHVARPRPRQPARPTPGDEVFDRVFFNPSFFRPSPNTPPPVHEHAWKLDPTGAGVEECWCGQWRFPVRP